MNAIVISLIVLIAVQVVHLYEEVHTGFRQQTPLAKMSVSVFVAANIFAFAFALATAILSFVGASIGAVAAWVYAIAMLLNGLLHVGMMLLKKGYFPGGVTAPLVLAAALNLIYQLSRS
jgi:hypothetical protein